MKSTLILSTFVLALVLTSCQSQTSKSEPSDSTVVKTDTVKKDTSKTYSRKFGEILGKTTNVAVESFKEIKTGYKTTRDTTKK